VGKFAVKLIIEGERMSKEISKRQLRREKMRRDAMRSRLITVGLISLGAIFLAFVFIYPNIRPQPEVILPEFHEYPAGEGLTLGDPNAPVKIEVFEDFQCPACQSFTQNTEVRILNELVETGKASYTFRHYPFLDTNSVSKESRQAANASMCANEQGKFWQYHEVIFANWNGENLGTFNDRRLIEFARVLELDMDSFESCFNENRYGDKIQADFDEGVSRGVSGTPSIFINGQVINPGFVPSFDEIAAAVEAAQ
jgi:protein-disulfide isomerase